MLATNVDSYQRTMVTSEAQTKILVCNAVQPVRILAIATREDLTIMREMRRLVASSMIPHFPAKCTRPI